MPFRRCFCRPGIETLRDRRLRGWWISKLFGLLEESRQVRINRDEKLKPAAKQQGLERARLLDEAISEMREEITSIYYPEIIEEIVALDKDDELGLRSKWNAAKEAEMRKIIMTDVMMISRLEKPERAITVY